MSDLERQIAATQALQDQIDKIMDSHFDDILRIGNEGPRPEDDTLVRQMALCLAGRILTSRVITDHECPDAPV